MTRGRHTPPRGKPVDRDEAGFRHLRFLRTEMSRAARAHALNPDDPALLRALEDAASVWTHANDEAMRKEMLQDAERLAAEERRWQESRPRLTAAQRSEMPTPRFTKKQRDDEPTVNIRTPAAAKTLALFPVAKR